MTTTENPARDEYFWQLMNQSSKWAESSQHEAVLLKGKILSVTYDTNVALQKRVEELEAALKEIEHQVNLTKQS